MDSLPKRRRKPGGSKKFSESYRKQVALTVIKENLTLQVAAARFGIPHQTISRWVRHFYNDIVETNVVESMTEPQNTADGNLSIYEDKLRKAQLKITALETMIELAENTYKIPIRKNSGTKQQE